MDDPASLRRLARAFDLAVRAHEGQTRAHGRGAPYVNHVADVARRMAESPAADEAALLAALLHDVVEKAGRGAAELEAAFGPEVAGVVVELTDDPRLSDAEARRAQVAGAPRLSDRAKRIRLADKASKLAEIADDPPAWWRRGGGREDLEHARAVVAGIRGADPVLEAAFDREAARAEAALA